MSVVSVNVEQLRQVIADLRVARTDAFGAALDLKGKLSTAGSWSSAVELWVSGQAIGWVDATIVYLQRRLDYAELLMAVTDPGVWAVGANGSAVVTFDDCVLVRMDQANVSEDVKAALDAVQAGDAQALHVILGKYQVESDDPVFTYVDPVFARVFASSVSVTLVADLLVGVDGAEDVDPVWHGQFLDDVAQMLSVGVGEMTGDQLQSFTAQWVSVTNDKVISTLNASRMPTEVHVTIGRIQALSLLVARGDWPGSFLTGLAQSIQGLEGDSGVGYWLGQGVGVKDPGLVDPATGEFMVVTDPMYGVWQAGVRNPGWFTQTYTGDTTTVEYITSGRNDPTHMFDTGTAEVFTGINDVFHRGFDQASYSAFLSAAATVDFQAIVEGREPVVLAQTQIVAKAMLLEDYRTPELPGWFHTALDVLSFVPVVEFAADGVNALLYWLEDDQINAGVCAAGVFIPGLLELPAKGYKWLKTVFKIGAKTPGPSVWDFVKATQDFYPGTALPRSFELDLGNGTSVWVHGNGTKHMYEHLYGGGNPLTGRIPSHTLPMAQQAMLLSLREAVKEATRKGILYDQPVNFGGWELKFGRPSDPGLLPVLHHANPFPK